MALLVACGMGGGMTSCSKQENEVSPVAVSSAAVRVSDGRLIFKDAATLQETIDKLKHKSYEDLAKWENSMHFASLRSSTGEEQTKLKETFGFPSVLEAIINPEGVYQVGEKVYWYHDGQKRQYNSLTDLEAAQRGEKVSFVPLVAGAAPVKVNGTLTADAPDQGRLYHNNLSGVDTRQREFCLWNNCNNLRKWVYETVVYTDQLTDIEQFWSTLNLRIKLEYRGRNGWRPAGESRVVEVDIFGNAGSGSSDTQTIVCQRTINAYDVRTVNYDLSYMLADCYQSAWVTSTTSAVYWNYTINGRINAYVTSDPGNAYTLSGNGLW